MLVTGAAVAFVQIELEVRVAADDLLRLAPDLRIDRRAAEVRVDDDAGTVDDAAEARRDIAREHLLHGRGRRTLVVRRRRLPQEREMGRGGVANAVAAELSDELRERAAGQDPLHRW